MQLETCLIHHNPVTWLILLVAACVLDFNPLQEKMNGAVTAMFHEPQLPDNPLEYISSQLCADKFQKADASIKRVEELEKEIKKLKSELRNVKAT